jgi:hypothetical protein
MCVTLTRNFWNFKQSGVRLEMMASWPISVVHLYITILTRLLGVMFHNFSMFPR